MYATLHGAFGTWPTESKEAFKISSTSKDRRPSALNETFDFGSESSSESARPVLTVRPESQPTGRVFIPPFFVPPGASPDSASSRPAPSHGHQHPERRLPQDRRDSVRHSETSTIVQPDRPGLKIQDGTVVDRSTVAAVQSSDVEALGASRPGLFHGHRDDIRPGPPVPELAPDLERAEWWSPEARNAFHDMVTGKGYINRYRLHMKKRERMMQYLQNPDREPMLCDGTRDYQTKYQAAHWAVIEGKLYRKPESGRVARYRQHLDNFEAWDVLTTEHIRSGHLGRDKLRKILEQNYIGYTLQEIMFVLKECQKCAGRANNGGRKDGDHDVDMEDASDHGTDHGTNESASPESPIKVEGPYGRHQTSNFMYY